MEPLAVMSGTVIHGKGLGRTVGMPTANIAWEGGLPLPEGVYASYATVEGKRYTGVTSIGRRPTVDSDERITVETNIIGFGKDIYGEEITLSLMCFLRPIRKMGSLEEVKAEVDKDRRRAVLLLG